FPAQVRADLARRVGWRPPHHHHLPPRGHRRRHARHLAPRRLRRSRGVLPRSQRRVGARARVAAGLSREGGDMKHVSPLRVSAWALSAATAANAFLRLKHFFLGPALCGGVITALMAWGTIRKSKGTREGEASTA